MINEVTTKNDLIKLFDELGLSTGVDVMVYSSMKSLGYVVNGSLDVIDGILDIIGVRQGTLLMPSHTRQLTDPSGWNNPSIPKEYVQKVKQYMLPYNKKLSAVTGRGIIPSTFLSYPGINRSDHPLNSVAALGKRSEYYTESHDFDEPEGQESPIGKLYKNHGKVLLLGVGFKRCTAVHLAEYIANVDYLLTDNPVVLFGKVNGVNKFARIKKYPGSSEYFDKITPELRRKDLLREIHFRSGTMTLFSLKPVVNCIISNLECDPEFLIKQ